MPAHPNRVLTRAAAMLAATALAGCVVPPQPIAPQQVPYVAVPGPTKTAAQFHQDDLTCRAAAVQLPPGPGVTPVRPSSTATTTNTPSMAPPSMEEPPGVTYFRCMAVRNNQIQPLPQAAPPLYAYYQPYPVYVGGYGDYYPWLYGPGFFGLYGGFGFGYGYGFGYGRGFYGGYGFRGGYYGGYRGGFEGGYRGGYGGGYGGGFHGGGGGFRR